MKMRIKRGVAPAALPNPAESRTLTTAKGRSVVTTLTDAEAVAKLATIPGKFAQDLHFKAGRYGLSHDQMVWAHILAIGQQERQKVELGDFATIISLFNTASGRLKHPKITLKARDGQTVQLAVAGRMSRNPGSINVTDGGRYPHNKYFGRIETTGRFSPYQAVTDAVVELLKRFAIDPAGVAAEYSRLTGNCCFCKKTLTDSRSVKVGYGPQCAEQYGLPWGG